MSGRSRGILPVGRSGRVGQDTFSDGGRPLEDLTLGAEILARTTALEEERQAALFSWIEARLTLGHHAELIPQLRQMAGEEPLRERTWTLLMTALCGAGRSAEALAAYQEVRWETVARPAGFRRPRQRG
jgi:pentatricopeptide repeat protein